MKTLLDLYNSHTGKVSDKWELYLREYDRLFSPYRDKAISLLEIGVQNGGSLEIWSQYFPNAQKFVGCDINPDCAQLRYEDPRIAVIVGDATTSEIQAKVFAQCTTFDLIIEDGSHTSGDIVKAFARYFPVLKTGGLFVAEDLHCSYWTEYEGGIFHPYSSMTFFKHLADMVNHEHWGVERSRVDLLAGFKKLLNIDFDESLMGQISSIEFINSVCVVRKTSLDTNCLGGRVVAGKTEAVVGGHLSVAGVELRGPIQTSNAWSNLVRPPAETYQELTYEINEVNRLLSQHLNVINELRNEKQVRQSEIARLNHLIFAVQSSRSWRYTAALRKVGTLARPVVKVLRRVKRSAQRNGGYASLGFKALALVRQEGWQGIRLRLSGGQLHSQVMTPDGQASGQNDYQTWIALYDLPDAASLAALIEAGARLPRQPLLSIVMPTYRPNLAWIAEAIDSVRAQTWPHWQLCIADDASDQPELRALLEDYARLDARIELVFRERNGHIAEASNSALALARGDWVLLLDHDDLIPPHALYCVAQAINEQPHARLIYSDEDKIDEQGRRFNPYFKSDWNRDLFYSHNMFSHLGCYELELLRDVGGFRVGTEGSQDYDLALRCIERAGEAAIHHIPRVLYHWRVHAQSTAQSADAKPYAMVMGERVINEHFVRTGVRGKVELQGAGYRPYYEIPEPAPLASILIPTRNGMSLLRNCIDSIETLTRYRPYEIIVIDNGSDDSDTLAYLHELQARGTARVLRDDRPFNYSALNNLAAGEARGQVLVLLNNDIQVISREWLDELVAHALRPNVGAVGARLWYGNNTLQHAGLLIGVGGVANPAHHRFSRAQPDYFGRSMLTQSFSAVTAACLAVRRELYLKMGGLDEINLAVAFNDVDFCLRLREAGYSNIYTPYAELYHLESVSRGPDISPEKVSRLQREETWMRKRWNEILRHDPAYNPNLSLEFSDFSYAWPPRTKSLISKLSVVD